MKPKRVLYIHHAKDFNSNAVYMSDDYFSANNSLFGAQQMDTWAGVRLLSSHLTVFRLQLSPNLRRFQFLEGMNVLFEGSFLVDSNFYSYLAPNKLRTLVKYRDTSIAINSDRNLKAQVMDFVKEYVIDFVWVDTQFYDSILPQSTPSVIRSVNFEPEHVLWEDPSKLRYFRYLAKVSSERNIIKNRNVVAISPADQMAYRNLGGIEPAILPLRQLPYLIDSIESIPLSSDYSPLPFPYIHFAASNFDVKHNHDNLKFILEKIAPGLKRLHPEVRVLIFGHRFPSSMTVPSNVRCMHFSNNFLQYIKNSLAAIVPHRGGAGMQSKIFEPLCMGIPLIANPIALSGYPFTVDREYLDGSDESSILKALAMILEKPERVSRVAMESKVKSHQLFSRDLFDSVLSQVIAHATH